MASKQVITCDGYNEDGSRCETSHTIEEGGPFGNRDFPKGWSTVTLMRQDEPPERPVALQRRDSMFKQFFEMLRGFANKPQLGVAEAAAALEQARSMASDVGGSAGIALLATIEAAKAHLLQAGGPEFSTRMNEMIDGLASLIDPPQPPMPPDIEEIELEMPRYAVQGVLCDKHPLPTFHVPEDRPGIGYCGVRPIRRVPRRAVSVGGGGVVEAAPVDVDPFPGC